MFQLVSKRPPASGGTQLPDPDVLLRIAERSESARSTDEDEFSLVVSNLRMGRAWKRTNRGRLTLAQHAVVHGLLPQTRPTVLDLGASDGLTTLELAHALQEKFGAGVRVFAADLNIWLLRYRLGPIFEYRAANGEPIMARWGRIGLRLAEKRRSLRQDADPLAALYLRMTGFRTAMQVDAKIPLVHPLVRHEPCVTVVELDCLVRYDHLAATFDAVRASNVLNLEYFSSRQIEAAIGNVFAYLVDGGCLVVSRNRDVGAGESEDGSAWRKRGDAFVHLADFGAGSEVKSIVDTWRNPSV